MSALTRQDRRGGGLAPALAAVRGRVVLVALLLLVAGIGWWWSLRQMRGMDNGPWTSLGGLGWFLGVWVVMMAAMMLPSVAPTVALYSRMTRGRSVAAPLVFAAGYIVTWGGAGLLAFAVTVAARSLGNNVLAWDHAGRWVAGTTLLVAAAYELTPLKDACLGRCRSPLGFLLSCWRDGRKGALWMGMRHGGWCVGCCWALMASLFALGIMSVTWMAFAGALIATQKILPWRRVATYGVAGALLALGVLLLVDPYAVPALTIPQGHQVSQMRAMSS